MASKTYAYGLGRRKSSTARARLYSGGKGSITINDKDASEYLSNSDYSITSLIKPLKLLSKEKEYDISLLVKGGGVNGQVEASRLAISNALASMNDTNRSTLKKEGLLKRDSREKERKKAGLKRARKAEQYTKR